MKLLKILLEQEKILVPRRSKEERAKNYQITINKEIQQYIENGSKGDLYLDYTSITSLSDNLKVGGDIYVHKSPLAEKYTDEEIKNLADIGGKIVRWNY